MQILYFIITILVSIVLIRLLFRKVFDLPAYTGKLLTENAGVDNLMPEDQFWYIINESGKESNHNYRLQCELLTNYLSQLKEEEIVAFDRTFGYLLANSYSFRLWEPVYSLNGGCSDDAFEYFREWLIAQGKNKFYRTLKNPRLLFLIGVKELLENWQGLAFCAYHAYEQKTGRDIPVRSDIHYPDGGPKFNEDRAFFRYPELALLTW